MSPSLPSTIIVSIVTIFLFPSETHTFETYGSPCSPLTPSCDPNNGLTCDLSSQTCTCTPGTTLTSNSKCRVLSSEPCNTTHRCDEDNHLSCLWNQTCGCDIGEKLVDNKCVATLYSRCGVQRNAPPCDTNLVCRWGSCQCPRDQIGDFSLFACRLKLNSSCDTNGGKICSEKSNLICGPSNRCECLPGLQPNQNGECVSKLNDLCDPTSSKCDTSDGLTCSETSGQCVCNTGLVADAEGQCRLGYNATCNYDDDQCDKTQLLTCGEEEICVCENDRAYLNGQCLGGKRHMSCSVNGTTSSGQSGKIFPDCDSRLKLECTNGECGCKENYEFDWDSRKCLPLWGQSCDLSNPCHNKTWAPLQCGVSGLCECPEGHFVDQDWRDTPRCMVGLGGSCKFVRCHLGKFLGCTQDNVCRCQWGMVEDEGVCKPKSFGEGCDPQKEIHCDFETGNEDFGQFLNSWIKPIAGQVRVFMKKYEKDINKIQFY